MSSRKNIRLTIAYDGTGYRGWQIQPDRPTIQGTIREALLRLTREEVRLIGSGRTDAGVHARALVASFHTSSRMDGARFAPALNRLLPREIRITGSREAPPDFHARFSARSKIYRYQVYRGPILPPHRRLEYYHYPYPIDLDRMHRAAACFVGTRNFASFCTGAARDAPGGDRSTTRRVLQSRITRRGHCIFYTVEADGFLQHMVRRLMGAILEAGRGQQTLRRLRGLLQRPKAGGSGFTVPARGLILVRVRY